MKNKSFLLLISAEHFCSSTLYFFNLEFKIEDFNDICHLKTFVALTRICEIKTFLNYYQSKNNVILSILSAKHFLYFCFVFLKLLIYSLVI